MALSENETSRIVRDVSDGNCSRTVCIGSAGCKYPWNFGGTSKDSPDHHIDKSRAWTGSVRTEKDRQTGGSDVLCSGEF